MCISIALGAKNFRVSSAGTQMAWAREIQLVEYCTYLYGGRYYITSMVHILQHGEVLLNFHSIMA